MEEIYLRFLAAFLVGALLSLSGSLIQLTSQNDLAGSSTLGIDALCVLVILIVHSVSIIYPISIPNEIVSLFLLIIISSILFLLVMRQNSKVIETHNKYFSQVGFFIFVGLCFNLFIGTLFYFLEFIFTTHGWVFPSQLWFGNFRFILPQANVILFIIFFIFYFYALKLGKKIKVISFSKDLGYGLGIDVKKLEITSLIFIIYYCNGYITVWCLLLLELYFLILAKF
ncbi:MAG: iron chelate uptake ABC transporter family permease subunit [Bacteriovoracaceae bacterium]